MEKEIVKMNSVPSNAVAQGVDKKPNEEKGKEEEVAKDDLKGKKADADPEKE